MARKGGRILTTNMLKDGALFKLRSDPKCSSFPPYSRGFIAYYEPGTHRQNTVKAYVIFTRLGKTGMERLEMKWIRTPLYYEKSLKEVMDFHKGDEKYYVRTKPSEIGTSDVRKMTDLDFLAWAAAKATMLCYASRCSGWGWDSMSTIGKFKRNAEGLFKAHGRVQTKIDFANEKIRIKFIKELREKEAELAKPILSHNKRLVVEHEMALSWLSSINENVDSEGKVSRLIPQAVLSRTMDAVLADKKAVDKLLKRTKVSTG